jgi:hypothetical protein
LASPRFIPLNPSSSSIPLAPAGALAPGSGGLQGLLPDLGGQDAGVGTPGFADEGAVTGIGALSGSQALSAFGSGLPGGIIGQSLGQATGISPTIAGLGGKIGMTGLGMLGGFPATPFGFANSLLGGLASLASAAQASVGPRGPSKSLSDTIRGLPATPDIEVEDSAIPDTSFAVPATVAYPDLDVTFPDVPGLSDGPSGVSDGTGNASGEGGGDSGGVGGVWFHGGAVHGPPGRDQVPGHLTAGEFVVDADSAHRFPGAVRALNAWEPGEDAPRGLQGLLRARQ